MSDFITRLVDSMEDIFSDNLICVLLLGSVQKNDTTPFSDIDLVSIIKEFDIKKMGLVRDLLKESERLVDLSFLCKDEISDSPELFALGTHGCYQLGLILNKAECIYGRNILLDINPPSKESIKRSLVQKIIQYTWWVRRMFVESNRERSLASNYQINSRLIKMIKGILYLAFSVNIHIEAKEAVDLFTEKCSFMLSEKEIIAILGIADKTKTASNSANMSEEYFETRFSVINKIHKEALKFYV